MRICYIHGANSTCLSFAQLKSKLPAHDAVNMEYSGKDSVDQTIEKYLKVIESYSEPVSIVSHSLGGVIAVSLAQRSKNISKVVTMATPFGGSALAGLVRWFVPNNVLFNDIHPHSAVLRALQRYEIHAPVLSFVTTSGHTILMQEDNDGVVTVASQLALSGPEYRKVSYNHFEVLLAPDVIKQVETYLFVTSPTP